MNLDATGDERDPVSAESGDAVYEGDYPPGPSVISNPPTDGDDARDEGDFPPGPSMSDPEPTDSVDADDDGSDGLDVDEDEAAEVTRAGQGSEIQPCI